MTDVPTGVQEHLDLDMHKCITNNNDWCLAKVELNQSRTIWAINTFKTFRSAGRWLE